MDYKFGSAWGGRCSIDPTGLYRVGLWKNIKRVWRMFYSHARFELEDGSRIRFRDDVWCGELTLAEAFPDLYSIACMKEVSVADLRFIWIFLVVPFSGM